MSPQDDKGRKTLEIVKQVNTRCENLCQDGKCGIYGKRSLKFKACVYYDCKGFGPPLSKYILTKDLLNSDGTLKVEAFDLFCLLNHMMTRTFHGSKDRELQDALDYYERFDTWPDWLFSKEYQDFIYSKNPDAINPRRNKIAHKTTPQKKSGEKHGILAFLKEKLKRR